MSSRYFNLNISFVPESHKKKLARDDKEKQELTKLRSERKTQLKAKREEWRKKAQTYFERQRDHQRSIVQKKREARNNGNYYVNPEAKVAFVIRLKG